MIKEILSWSVYDVIQLIIAFLSLASTVVISIVIYKLDRKREKQIKEENEKIERMNLEHEAEIFLIKNGDEIEFLPLCVFANNLNGTKKHKRVIYNNFNVCSDELKKEILKKQKIYITEIKENDWFSRCNSMFQKEIKKYNIGHPMFYDNAKYVQHCFDYYGKENIPQPKEEFEFPFYSVIKEKLELNKICKCGLYFYVCRYFDYLEDVKKYDNHMNIEFYPPCDFVYEMAVCKDQDEYCYWCAELMRYLCSRLREEKLESSFCCTPYSPAIEIQPEYFEDLFYCAVYELYLTFGKGLKNTQCQEDNDSLLSDWVNSDD